MAQPKGQPSRARTARKAGSGPAKEARNFTYRGRSVELRPADEGRAVIIDGERVEYMVTDDGVYSHDFAYQTFGSAEELAEELIRQWGQAKIARTPVSHDAGHGDHPHDDKDHHSKKDDDQ